MHGFCFILTQLSRPQEGGEGGWGPAGRGAVREPEEAHSPCPPQHLQLVRQEMAVCPEQLGEFLDSLRQYLRGTAGARSCFQ